MDHPYYLPLPSLLFPNHNHWSQEKILSSTPLRENGEDVDRRGIYIRDHQEKRQILRDQNRKIFHPPPIEGIDIGVMEGLETLDP